MSRRTTLLSCLVSTLIGLSCVRTQGATSDGACALVGDDVGVATLRQLHAKHGLLVIAGDDVFRCDCPGRAAEDRKFGNASEGRKFGTAAEDRRFGNTAEDRKFGTAAEDRRFGNAAEDRRFGNAAEDRKFGSAAEDRKFGSAAEDRKFGNAAEDRKFGSAAEGRDFGTAAESLACIEHPDCSGFVVSGSGALQIFDGTTLHPLAGRCVPSSASVR